MPFPFKQIEAHDPNNPGLVAPNAMVTIFEPGDPAKTPLTLTTLTGEPLANPVTVNGLGYGPAFMHATLPQVAWAGGGLTGTFESYEGMRDEAIAAVAAAESANASAAAAAAQAEVAATAPTDEAVDAAIGRADLPGIVTEVVATNPAVTSEAALLAQSNASLVRKTDSGIPQSRTLTQDNYLDVKMSPSGRLLEGIRRDGSHEVAASRVGGALTANEMQDQYIYAVLTPSRKMIYGVRKDGHVEVGGSIIGTPTPDPYDVVIVAGQSNATQIGNLPVAPHDIDSRLFRWNGSAIEALPASQTYVGSSFARAYAQSTPGRRVLIVDAAVGSTGFTSTSLASPPAGYHTVSGGTWDRTLTSDPINLYSQMITKTQAALAAAGTGARLAAMIWVQGEEDTFNPSLDTATYGAKLDDLISAARTALAVPSLPVLIGSMTPQFILEFATGSSGREKVHFAHMDTPRRVQSTAFVWGPEDMEHYNDTIHFSPQANKARGPMFIEALYRAKENVSTAKPLPPMNLRASRSGDTVTVKWDAPPARATAFTVEYSINGGAWTALTLPVAIALSGTFTATAGQPVKVRGKSTNEIGTTHYTREVAL